MTGGMSWGPFALKYETATHVQQQEISYSTGIHVMGSLCQSSLNEPGSSQNNG